MQLYGTYKGNGFLNYCPCECLEYQVAGDCKPSCLYTCCPHVTSPMCSPPCPACCCYGNFFVFMGCLGYPPGTFLPICLCLPTAATPVYCCKDVYCLGGGCIYVGEKDIIKIHPCPNYIPCLAGPCGYIRKEEFDNVSAEAKPAVEGDAQTEATAQVEMERT